MKFLILLILATTISAPVLGGFEKGNGGDVYYCEKENKAYLLDYEEAKLRKWPGTRKPWTVSLGKPDLGYKEKVKIALDRIAIFDPVRANRYELEAQKFYDFENHTYMGGEIGDVDDSEWLVKKRGCEAKQIAIRPNKKLDISYTYLVDKELWEVLDNDHKAGLVLHEVIYGEAFDHGHTNSMASRKFVALISTKEFTSQTREFYNSFIWDNKFYIAPAHNYTFSEESVVRAAKGNIIRGKTNLGRKQTVTVDGQLLSILPGSEIFFNLDGSIALITTDNKEVYLGENKKLELVAPAQIQFNFFGEIGRVHINLDDQRYLFDVARAWQKLEKTKYLEDYQKLSLHRSLYIKLLRNVKNIISNYSNQTMVFYENSNRIVGIVSVSSTLQKQVSFETLSDSKNQALSYCKLLFRDTTVKNKSWSFLNSFFKIKPVFSDPKENLDMTQFCD